MSCAVQRGGVRRGRGEKERATLVERGERGGERVRGKASVSPQ